MEAPPRYLYRYRSLSGDGRKWVEASILRQEHFFAPATAFNDPFDCRPFFSFTATNVQLISYFEAIIGRHAPHMSRQERRAEARRRVKDPLCDPRRLENLSEFHRTYEENVTNRVGILCLSEVPDDILMWGHYGNAHQGICLQFDATNEYLAKAQPVHYQQERPVVNPIYQTYDKMLDRAMYTKSDHWSYEKEWRYVQYSHGAGVYRIPSSLLTGIVLGAQISDVDRQLVMEWAGALPSSPPTIYQAKLSSTQFAIHIEPAHRGGT